MAIDKFKFISPGVFINEIDESSIPALPERMGPILLGRFKKGPSNRPVTVSSYNELVAQFGTPAPGTATGDIWRTGAMTAPTYAAYAAQAWLRNNTPCTIVRMLGVQNDNATGFDANPTSISGWRLNNTLEESPGAGEKVGGAYGLFVMPDPDSTGHGATAASVGILINPDGNVHEDTTLAGHILIGLPTHISGGAAQAGAGGNPVAGDSLSLLFQLDGGIANAAANIVHVAAGAAPTTNPDEGMTNLAALINGTLATTKFDDGGTDASHASLAAVQAAYSASWSSTDATTGVLTLTTTAGGAAANNHLIQLDAEIAGTADAIVLGTTTDPTGTNDDWISAITASTVSAVTGTLGAVWYVDDGWVELSGTLRSDPSKSSSTAAALIKSTDQKFTVQVMSGTTHTNGAAQSPKAEFNFTPTSDQFIRKVYNTDPTAVNTDLVDTAAGGVLQKYWLGETFEDNVKNEMKKTPSGGTQVSASSTGDFLGIILGLQEASGLSVDWADRNNDSSAASTGWFFSNDIRGTTTAGFDPTDETNVSKLFRFVALDNGENVNRDIKISIVDVKAPSNQFIKYGTFGVVIRDAEDTDTNPVVFERYSNLTLNPVASNYISRVIGNKKYIWDDAAKTVRQFGKYNNKSKWTRVEVSPLVENGNAEGLLPYGVYGPVAMKGFQIRSGASTVVGVTPALVLDDVGATLDSGSWFASGVGLPTGSIDGTNTGLSGDGNDTLAWDAGGQDITASIVYPKSRIRDKSSDGGLTLNTQAYFGYQSNRKGTRVYCSENLDHFRGAPKSLDMQATASGETDFSWIFTLDDIVFDADTGVATFTTGSRKDGTSKTAVGGSEAVLDAGFNRFTSPVFGGHDGLDIKEKDPFRNRYLTDKGGSATTNYAFNTIERNIDMIADAEFVEFDIAAIPGITNETLTDKLIVACETRGDALAVIDLKGGYEPPHEGIDSGITTDTRTGSVDDVVNNLKDRALNSSYGCAFFPYVQVRDTTSDAILFVPPSVVAIGTFSSSQRKSAVWFAPAGFTRGGLSEGSAGIPVIGTRTRVTAAQRDKLYDANINPIATFPAEGVVIFGQKTLQVTPSALDRINVRRLLIYLKKEISNIASKTLFEQNVQATWDKFTGQVNPFLKSVKAGLGLTDFKVVLDKSTTTDDLIDRNILYAKIFLKPARSIEFIALDFIITRSGASFDD